MKPPRACALGEKLRPFPFAAMEGAYCRSPAAPRMREGRPSLPLQVSAGWEKALHARVLRLIPLRASPVLRAGLIPVPLPA